MVAVRLLLLYGVTVPLTTRLCSHAGGDLAFDSMPRYPRNNGDESGKKATLRRTYEALSAPSTRRRGQGGMSFLSVFGPLVFSFVQVDEDAGWLAGWLSATSMHDEKVSATPNRLGGVLWLVQKERSRRGEGAAVDPGTYLPTDLSWRSVSAASSVPPHRLC